MCSRFARNTLDCLKYIRQLKDKSTAVFFEKENINTMDSKGEVLLTIMACPYHKRRNIADSSGQGN
ncbi:recombinase family protein [Sporolactobacillus sp. Y61]|uniref:Recombinase family protein n=1 Tax=Sporolactobacillus sp. Y61 TaxID=3160863 RepID=A0AAU8IJE2_9BACL